MSNNDTLVDRLLQRAKNSKILAILIVLGIGYLAVSKIIKATKDNYEIFKGEDATKEIEMIDSSSLNNK